MSTILSHQAYKYLTLVSNREKRVNNHHIVLIRNAISASRSFSTIMPTGAVIPTPRYQHSAQVSDGHMIVFGGGSENTLLNDLFVFSFGMN